MSVWAVVKRYMWRWVVVVRANAIGTDEVDAGFSHTYASMSFFCFFFALRGEKAF